MRVLVCLLFLIISFGCFGQTILNPVGILRINQDTVPVIMLCIDTSAHQSGFSLESINDWPNLPSGTSAGITFPTASHPDLGNTFYDYSVFWVKGYEVVVWDEGRRFYLNERKKKLNPCYIIWQSIEIK